MKIGYIGLGKMGYNQVLRLNKTNVSVVAYNRSKEPLQKISKQKVPVAYTLTELFNSLPKNNRIIWLMVSHTAVDNVLSKLKPHLKRGDTIIDGGNSFYKNTITRSKAYKKLGVNYIDVGVSGGPSGALNGASLMVGGDKQVVKKISPIFKKLGVGGNYSYIGESGAGHFVKMVHNAIEYGMMQSIAEGFDLIKNSKLKINLNETLNAYSKGSVIESSLINWLISGFNKHTYKLKGVSKTAKHSGEAKWAVRVAKELGVKFKIIEGSLKAREFSKTKPNYQAQIIQVLRSEFGGHNK